MSVDVNTLIPDESKPHRAMLVIAAAIDAKGETGVLIDAKVEGEKDLTNPAHAALDRIVRALPFVMDPRFEKVIGGFWNLVANSNVADGEKGAEVLGGN